MFPEELAPPPFFASFGRGSLGAGLIAGAGARPTSVPWLQPIAEPATIADRVENATTFLNRIEPSQEQGGR